jgi:hypothetical protein
MGRSEAMKKAQKKYMEKIKGTEIGQRVRESQLLSAKNAFNRRYANDEEFRKNKNLYSIQQYYYKSAEDSALKCIKKLFGEYAVYGR